MLTILCWLQLAVQIALLTPEPEVRKCVLIPSTNGGEPTENIVIEK